MVTSELINAVSRAVTLASEAWGDGRSRSVLVLGDASANLCEAISHFGHDVLCCPDLQRPREGSGIHTRTVAERVEDLISTELAVDLVVAVDGWTRILNTNSFLACDRIINWIREHSVVALFEAPRRVLAMDLNDLGPYTVHETLGSFRFFAEAASIEGTRDLKSPTIFASDQFLLVNGEWIPAAEVHWLREADNDSHTKPVRTFRVPGDRIVKVECTSEEYFERTQVLGEWAFLERADSASKAALDLPRVHDLVRGRAVTTLVRDLVPGGEETGLAMRHQVAGMVDVATRYASLGIFHNDFRPWNMMWQRGTVRMIDFAEASNVDDDIRDLPQILALAGSIASLATKEIRGGEQFHLDVLDIARDCGVINRWPLRRQLTEPWLRLPRVQNFVESLIECTSASAIFMKVLEETGG